MAPTPVWDTDSAPVNGTRILLWYPAWLRAAAISGLASATERSRHEVSLPSPGMTALGTPMRWPALSIAAPPELPCATRAVVSSSNRGSVTCPMRVGHERGQDTAGDGDRLRIGHAREPEHGHRLIELKRGTLPTVR